ncbi:FadR/GntR family transcriptional regulator [Orrella sp. JC864]|uniref:FadR/GntR family transcriptional regulator n=1 Tax=Orrella sp. JC864 TaxID=3120298 RepID=UPI0030090150
MSQDTARRSPTENSTLASQVTETLRREIRNGLFPVHSHLPTELALTRRFGVSRTVVREAISRLRSDGLVDTRQGSGTVVLGPNANTPFRIDLDVRGSIDDALCVLELRRSLEAEMASLAAQRRTEAQAARIWRALQAIADAGEHGSDGVREDIGFHMAIAQASGNPLFPSMLQFLGHFLHEAIGLTRGNEARNPRMARQVVAEHTAIAQAIADRDAAAARRAASAHMRNTDGRIRAAMPLPSSSTTSA